MAAAITAIMETAILEDQASAASMLSWNTSLSRTSVSSLSCAVFSGNQSQAAHGLGDVIKNVRALNLRRFCNQDFSHQNSLGEGETYIVQRGVARDGGVFAVKHIRVDDQADNKLFQRRLRSVILELQIMRHPPLKAHPNITSALGYGWNTRGNTIMPYIVVEHASLGTFRQHVKHAPRSLSDIEILAGDVATGLAALHICGIVHGDLKLDNVLIFPSMDRPSKALAKITDFGHALVLSDTPKGRGSKGQSRLMYTGTSMYNAPEVQEQGECPIDRTYLSRCDLWAFGLLVWEACIMGAEFPQGLDLTTLHKVAKQDIHGPNWGAPFFLRVAVHKCLQTDPSMRPADAQGLPLFTRWNTSNRSSLQAKLALHIEAPMPTYEVFRLDNDRDISWAHQKQIFDSLMDAFQDKLAQEVSSVTWQIALCHHIGFGTAQDQVRADEFAGIASMDDHPVAARFASLLTPGPAESTNPDVYAAQLASLLRSDATSRAGLPLIVGAFFDGDAELARKLLSEGAYLGASTIDGCSPLHWLFMFQDQESLDNVVDILRKLKTSHLAGLIDLPFGSPRETHAQWPLQLLGTPLAVAISVNSLRTVEALLELGADPFAPVYHESQFPPGDLRLQWTAFHVAVKYHCSDILKRLMKYLYDKPHDDFSPIACALSFSTSLERLAMHGSEHEIRLSETISLIRDVQSLACVGPSGMTALMQAIDFKDRDVAAALLHADPELATTPFASPKDSKIFTLPIHFAAQIASQHDVQDTLEIPELINSYTRQLSPETDPPRDHAGRTPLHLAATGSSTVVAKWILEKRPGLLHVEDDLGRTPLHYGTSVGVCKLLLEQGAGVDHTDKFGMTTLHQACLKGAAELIPTLLKSGAMLDLKNNKFGTPLHCGVISGSFETVLALIEARAPLDATDLMLNTAAHVAAKLDRHQILKLLSHKGADMTLKNVHGRDPRRIALDEGRLGSVGILRILQPSWEATTQQILNAEARTFLMAQEVVGEVAAPGEDFMWKKDEIMDRVDEKTTARPDDISGKEEDDRREEHEDAAMRAVERTIDKLDRLGQWRMSEADKTFIDSLVDSTMALVDGSIWQSDLATRALEIMTRTAHDLAMAVSFEISSDTNSLASWTEVRNERSSVLEGQNKEDEDEESSNLGNRSENLIGEDGVEEDEDGDVDLASDLTAPKLAGCPCHSYRDHWQGLVLMIHHVASIVITTRPPGILPGRERPDLRNMIFSELSRLYDQATLLESVVDGGGKENAQQIVTFFRGSHHFLRPWLGRPFDRFQQWKRRQLYSTAASTNPKRPSDGFFMDGFLQEQQWRKDFHKRQRRDS